MDIHIGWELIPLVLLVLYVVWKAGKIAGNAQAWREITKRNRIAAIRKPSHHQHEPQRLRVLRDSNGSED
jgi:hypothetical protein